MIPLPKTVFGYALISGVSAFDFKPTIGIEIGYY